MRYDKIIIRGVSIPTCMYYIKFSSHYLLDIVTCIFLAFISESTLADEKLWYW